jgi:hypothetical protein
MRIFKLLFLLLQFTSVNSGQGISGYVTITGYGACKPDGEDLIVLRKFLLADQSFYLALSPFSLKTQILRSGSITFIPAPWEEIRSRYSSTPYIKAIIQAESYSYALQDAGFTRFLPSQNGIDLTLDLCPSQRPLDRIVFTDLIHEVGLIEKPVPIAISITGKWIGMHQEDLNWLKELVRAGELSIVWINHSFNHFTKKNLPLIKNFMLEPGTDINAEVLNTEIALLQEDIIPSVFFRFPGLVSDRTVYNRILNFGLIPIGSDAWLAKGQSPLNGSIVLIHANGNEPVGIRDFIDLLKKEGPYILSRRWELYDLRESLVYDENR